YVVEDSWSITASGNGSISFTNWNYYASINAVWDIDNTNFGDGTSTKALGIGVQLASNGPIYGAIADNGYNTNNNNKKRTLAAQSGVAVTWVTPDDAGNYALNSGNTYTLSLKQWFYKSTNTLYDFMLQAQL